MTGYESIMLLCAIVSTIVTVASFVYAIRKALDKKRNKRTTYCLKLKLVFMVKTREEM